MFNSKRLKRIEHRLNELERLSTAPYGRVGRVETMAERASALAANANERLHALMDYLGVTFVHTEAARTVQRAKKPKAKCKKS